MSQPRSELAEVAALETVLVALIVSGCALFSAWRLMSVRARLKLLEWLMAIPGIGAAPLLSRLRNKALTGLAGGCGGCAHAVPQFNGSLAPANRRPAAPHR
jgi:hypothetical protein